MAETLGNDRYRTLRKLGEGATSEVFLVSDLALGGHELALKRVRAAKDELELVKHEFKLLAQLDHPGVLKVHDFGTAEGGFYYTSEFLGGEDLLAATRDLDWEGFYEIARAILSTLAYIHGRGLVHYDVKPTNVNVRKSPPESPGGRATFSVKLVDFGLTGEAIPRRGGKVKGTAHYLAPEVAKEQPSDARADLYSLGVSLHQAISGKLPFDGKTAYDVIRRHLEEAPAPLRSLRADVPEGWERFVLRLLEKDPADRFPSAEAALSALSRLAGKTRTERVAPAPERRIAPLAPRFVGRSRELEVLSRALPGPSRPRAAPLVAILTGEAGVGKSRLLSELKVVSQLRGVPFVRAECGEGSGAVPLARATRQVLFLESDPPPTFARSDSDTSSHEAAPLPSLSIEELAREYRRDLEAVFPGLTGGEPAPDSPRERDGRLVRDRVARFLLRAARARPFVLAIEDVHAADDATIALVFALARNLLFDARAASARGAPPILVAISLRESEAKERPALASLLALAQEPLRAVRLELRGLDASETAQAAASMLALSSPEAALGSALHRATSGNPFFLEDLVRSLVEDGVLALRVGLAPGKTLGEVEPRGSVADLLGKKLSSLEPDAREVLRALAVLAGASPLDVLARTAGLDAERVLDALDSLARQKLVLREPGDEEGEGPRFALSHAHVQRAASAGLDPATERSMHERAALALETRARSSERPLPVERLARHFSLALVSEKAVLYSLEAGERAARAHRNEEAVLHLGRALDLLRKNAASLATSLGETRSRELEERALEALGDALSIAGRHDDAARALEELAARSDLALESAVRVRRRLGSVARRRGDYSRASAWLEEALERARGPLLRRERAKALQAMARIDLWRGKYEGAIALATEALAAWRALKGAGRERMASLNVLSSAEYYRGRYTRAAELLRESLELARRSASSWHGLIEGLGIGEETDRAFESALATLSRPGAIRRCAGDAFGIVLAFDELGTCFDLRGDLAMNVRYHETALDAYERMGSPQGMALSLNNLGVYARMQGDLARALASTERALALHEGTRERHGGAVALLNLAMLRLALGDVEGAEERARRALALSLELGIAWMSGHARRVLGRAAARRSLAQDSERELGLALAVFRELGNPRSTGDVLLDRSEAALERGDGPSALALLEEARKTGEEAKGEDFLARARLVTGRAALAHDPALAVSELEAALASAEALGVAELQLDARRALVSAHLAHGTLRLASRHAEAATELEEKLARGLPQDLRETAFRSAPWAKAREVALRLRERLLSQGT